MERGQESRHTPLRLIERVASYLTKANPALAGEQETAADPRGTISQHIGSVSIGGNVLFGMVVDYVPYTRLYKVLIENGKAPIDCYRLLETGGTPIGIADCSNLQVNTPVYVILHPKQKSGYIIGVEPPFMFDARRGMSDVIHQASCCGLHVDAAHQFPFKLGPPGSNGGISDRSARAPFDSVDIGEFNKVSETGLMLHMDSYLAQMRVDEATGLFLFYWDQLCRIAGVNFQRWAAASELEAYDDEGEHAFYEGLAGYPWEHLSLLQPPPAVSISKEYTAEEIQGTDPCHSRVEPFADDRQAFHRLRRYGGYLGQAEKRLIASPYIKGTGPQALAQAYQDEQLYAGLAELNLTQAGHMAYRTALGSTIGKQPFIPVPKRKETVADPQGDNKENYKHSSQFGNGAAHKVKPSPEPQGDHPGLERAAGVQDLRAHIFNWESSNAFHYHEKDYHYPEEGDVADEFIESESLADSRIPSFMELKGYDKGNLDPPTPFQIKIDHREGGVAWVFPNNAHLTFLDDGGLVLGDGFGSEIVMTGGNIRPNCAGDFMVEAGRNVINWAGRDIIMRAKQSVDVTATDNDVRLKAHNNMQLIAAAGEGYNHGMLLESRSTGSDYPFDDPGHDCEYNGIILRSINSPIVSWSKAMFIKTRGSGGYANSIVLDANNGDSSIVSRSRYFDRWNSVACRDFFTSSANIEEGEVTRVNSWNGLGNIVSGSFWSELGIGTSGGVTARYDINSTEGHFNSPQGGEVTVLVPPRLTALRRSLTLAEQYDTAETLVGNTENTSINDLYYIDDRPGNQDVINRGEASFRADTDYGASGFVLFETRWAQMIRAGEEEPGQWIEQPLSFGSTATYPFPGQAKFNQEQIYFQQDNALYETDKLHAKERGELFEDPKYAKPQENYLNQTYPVVG